MTTHNTDTDSAPHTTPIDFSNRTAPAPAVPKTEWKPVGGLQTVYFKWSTPGQIISGEWVGTVQGKFGQQGVIEGREVSVLGVPTTVNVDDDTASFRYVFTLHTALANRLRDVQPGTTVKVVYRGTAVSAKTKRVFKNFDVFSQVTP